MSNPVTQQMAPIGSFIPNVASAATATDFSVGGERTPILSLVVAIFNDGSLAEPFCRTLQSVMTTYLKTDSLNDCLEVIFVDDGSSNDSVEHLRKLAAEYPWVKVVELSRNFGQHIALSCGFQYASGQLVGVLDVDMQDPLTDLPKLIDYILLGTCDVVQGVRTVRKDPLLKRLSSRAFVWIFNKVTKFDLPRNPSTLRVMSRKYIDSFNRYTERVRFAPGLEYWLGFKREFVTVGHVERASGSSSYNFYKRCSMALEAIISFTDIPLKVSIFGGILLAGAGIFLALALVVVKLLLLPILPGYTSIVSILLFSQGAILIILGIMGLYIGRILKEVQNRPLFVVRQTHNLGPTNS